MLFSHSCLGITQECETLCLSFVTFNLILFILMMAPMVNYQPSKYVKENKELLGLETACLKNVNQLFT